MRVEAAQSNLFQRLPVGGARPAPGPAPPLPSAEERRTERSPFLARIADAVAQVNSLQQAADLEAERLATGDTQSLQDLVISLEKADLALQLTVQVTQRAVEAYREISRMQV